VASIGASGITTTYVCNDQTVTINGNLAVNGPVNFYINLDSATNTSFANNGTPTLFISGGSNVNMPSDGTLPDATLLKVYTNSIGTVGNYHGNGGYNLGAVVVAPGASPATGAKATTTAPSSSTSSPATVAAKGTTFHSATTTS
jgi:hypothetical protein